ncbi:hypothetical protein J5N97_004171 [Dioscorea zingiberensis]|uniref:AAA+ ATPase domain-containing protein n=1 Tax=Dioscorea zingiberensis TaxID=325984 RepID=A0A9D5HQQ9_9LILI|nr:hypothetical protein J5N97_004171 [Dioscorea zingiberensis]
MLARTVLNDLFPGEFRDYVSSGVNYLWNHVSPELTIVIQEKDGYNVNNVYQAAMAYLSSRISPSTRRFKVKKEDADKSMVLSLDKGEHMMDVFEGIQFRWCLRCHENRRINIPVDHDSNSSSSSTMSLGSHLFELSFNKKHKEKALDVYLPWILDWWEASKKQDKNLKLFLNEIEEWVPINLQHPSSFDTLAMDPELKRTLMEDLSRFTQSKDYYRRIGKAWKRGYLLYGPPGTGKSSLIAAMANFLKYDIYDLELAEVRWTSSLRRLLVEISNRSIIVIEDIDCSVALENRDNLESTPSRTEKVTLSALLNFVDGLWSSCGEERIIVFTTNCKDRLDPALLRPGRMDMHIYMGYCTPSMFRILASNYHAVDDHPLFGEIDELIKDVQITPAAVAEELMKRDDVDAALRGLVDTLHQQKELEAKVQSLDDGEMSHHEDSDQEE